MNLLDLAKTCIVLDPDETVSKAVGELYRKKAHEAVVAKDREIQGMLNVAELARRNIEVPHKTKIRHFLSPVKPIENQSLEELIRFMLINNFRAVPYVHEGEIYTISTSEIIKTIKNNPSFKGKRAEYIMVYPYVVNTSDSINSTISLIRKAKISRVPVVNEKYEVQGIIDTLELANHMLIKSRARIGEFVGERIRPLEAKISSIMAKTFTLVTPDASVTEIVKKMGVNQTLEVLVADKGRLTGIVTPKQILKLFGKKVKGVYITFPGLGEEDPFIRNIIYEEVTSHIQMVGKILHINYAVFHIDRYFKKPGMRTKYSVKARLITGEGFFFAKNHGWDLTKVFKELLEKLEKEILKKKGKSRLYHIIEKENI